MPKGEPRQVIEPPQEPSVEADLELEDVAVVVATVDELAEFTVLVADGVEEMPVPV